MISTREIQQTDIELILNYWYTATDDFLIGMGVDLAKMPKKEDFRKMLESQLPLPYNEKKSYCIIWQIDGQPIGHSNINNITFGQEAFMHLHMWKSDTRRKGTGTQLVRMTVPYFFENMNLKVLYCEPYALNPAPNKTLPKAGFEFVKEYRTVPSTICSEQPVKRWCLTREHFLERVQAKSN